MSTHTTVNNLQINLAADVCVRNARVFKCAQYIFFKYEPFSLFSPLSLSVRVIFLKRGVCALFVSSLVLSSFIITIQYFKHSRSCALFIRELFNVQREAKTACPCVLLCFDACASCVGSHSPNISSHSNVRLHCVQVENCQVRAQLFPIDAAAATAATNNNRRLSAALLTMLLSWLDQTKEREKKKPTNTKINYNISIKSANKTNNCSVELYD